MPYTFEPLDPSRHDRAAFACGEPQLDTYLKTQARQDMDRDLALCYVLCEQGNSTIIGYYTLSSYSVALAELPPEQAKSAGRYKTVPAVLLGRLAIAMPYHGQRMSKFLLIDALRRSWRSGIAIKLVVVDALHEAAGAFYEHHGFRRLQEDNSLRLYVPMAHVRALFPNEAAEPEDEAQASAADEPASNP